MIRQTRERAGTWTSRLPVGERDWIGNLATPRKSALTLVFTVCIDDAGGPVRGHAIDFR
jgi:hypothetical protein